MHRSLFSFGKLLLSLAVGFASCTAFAQDATGNKVVVMTSYPDAMVALYKTAFEKKYPDMQVEVFKRDVAQALTDLRKPDQAGIDVYWAPAQRNFLALAKEHAFHRLNVVSAGLPVGIGGFPLSDPAGYYAAFEMAGYGFAVNAQRLQQKGLSQPTDWLDLTDNKWKDEIIFPAPDQVGFVPLMIDTVLQNYGWERGWSILQAIGANAQLIGERGGNIADDISKGQASVGLSIDFPINAAIAKGAPMTFVYPAAPGYSVAHVAIMKNAPHVVPAQAFADFVLSQEGQKLLFDAGIRKLPVRPSVYAAKPDGYYDPFNVKISRPVVFSPQRAYERQDLNNALFNLLITDTQMQLREVLDTVSQAERAAAASSNPALVEQARKARVLSGAVPFNAVQATGYAEQFSSTSASAQKRNDDLISEWKKQIRKNRNEAEKSAMQVLRAAGK